MKVIAFYLFCFWSQINICNFGGSLKYMIWHVIKTLNMAIEETVVKVLVYRDAYNYFDWLVTLKWDLNKDAIPVLLNFSSSLCKYKVVLPSAVASPPKIDMEFGLWNFLLWESFLNICVATYQICKLEIGKW